MNKTSKVAAIGRILFVRIVIGYRIKESPIFKVHLNTANVIIKSQLLIVSV